MLLHLPWRQALLDMHEPELALAFNTDHPPNASACIFVRQVTPRIHSHACYLRASVMPCLRQSLLQVQYRATATCRHGLSSVSTIVELADTVILEVVTHQVSDQAITATNERNDVISDPERFVMLVSAWMVHIGHNGGRSKIDLVSRSVRCLANATDAAKVGMSRGSTEHAVTAVPATARNLSCFKQAEKLLDVVGFFPF